jgi:hypothetical protein
LTAVWVARYRGLKCRRRVSSLPAAVMIDGKACTIQRKPDALRLLWAEGASALPGHPAPPDRYLGGMDVRLNG